jgi:hypothetical protein
LFTYYCENEIISENCWKLLPYIHKAFKEWAYDYIEELVPPLDNFISKNCDLFLSNPNHLKIVNDICSIYLNNTEATEHEVINAFKIISVLIQNCKGKINDQIPIYLDFTLLQLFHRNDDHMSNSLKTILIDTIADCIHYHLQLTLQYLEHKQLTTKVFELWFSHIDKLKRNFDKKLSVIAFSNILAFTKLRVSFSKNLFSLKVNSSN